MKRLREAVRRKWPGVKGKIMIVPS